MESRQLHPQALRPPRWLSSRGSLFLLLQHVHPPYQRWAEEVGKGHTSGSVTETQPSAPGHLRWIPRNLLIHKPKFRILVSAEGNRVRNGPD